MPCPNPECGADDSCLGISWRGTLAHRAALDLGIHGEPVKLTRLDLTGISEERGVLYCTECEEEWSEGQLRAMGVEFEGPWHDGEYEIGVDVAVAQASYGVRLEVEG